MITERTVERSAERELLIDVRNVVTLDGGLPIYRNAKIELRNFYPEEVYPTAKYVISGNLETLRAIDEIMTNEGYDIFHLRERVENGVGVISPPIVEMSDGVPAIVDGQHRFWLAREKRQDVTAIYVEGVNPDYPIIGFPVDWDLVREYEERPIKRELIRDLRFPDDSSVLRKYFRDLRYFGSMGRRPGLMQTG